MEDNTVITEIISGIITDVSYYLEKRINILLNIKSPVKKEIIKENARANIILINGYTKLVSEKLEKFNDWSFWVNVLKSFDLNIFIPIFEDFKNSGLEEHKNQVQLIIDNIKKLNNKQIYIVGFSYGTIIANEIAKNNNIEYLILIGSPINGYNSYIGNRYKDITKTSKDIINYSGKVFEKTLFIYGKNDYLVKPYYSKNSIVLDNLTHYTLVRNNYVIFICLIIIIFNNKSDYIQHKSIS